MTKTKLEKKKWYVIMYDMTVCTKWSKWKMNVSNKDLDHD